MKKIILWTSAAVVSLVALLTVSEKIGIFFGKKLGIAIADFCIEATKEES